MANTKDASSQPAKSAKAEKAPTGTVVPVPAPDTALVAPVTFETTVDGLSEHSRAYARVILWCRDWLAGVLGAPIPLRFRVFASFPTTRATKATDTKWREVIPPTQELRSNVSRVAVERAMTAGTSKIVAEGTPDGPVYVREVTADGSYALLFSPMTEDAFSLVQSGVLSLLEAMYDGTGPTFQTIADKVGFEKGHKLDADGNRRLNAKGEEYPSSWRYATMKADLRDTFRQIIDGDPETFKIPAPLDYRAFAINPAKRAVRGILACPDGKACGKDEKGDPVALSFAITPTQYALIDGAVCRTHNLPLAWTPPVVDESKPEQPATAQPEAPEQAVA